MLGRLCDVRLLVDEWRLERGDDEEKPNAKKPTESLLMSLKNMVKGETVDYDICMFIYIHFSY